MALAPKTATSTQAISIRVPQDFLDLLDEYVGYLGHASDRTYVLIESARQQIASDRGFKAARAARARTLTHLTGEDPDERPRPAPNGGPA